MNDEFWYDHEMSTWGYGLMTVSMVLFWGLVIFLVVALIRYTSQVQDAADNRPARPTPEKMLAERFARGEIDEQEFQSRRATLHDSPPQVT